MKTKKLTNWAFLLGMAAILTGCTNNDNPSTPKKYVVSHISAQENGITLDENFYSYDAQGRIVFSYQFTGNQVSSYSDHAIVDTQMGPFSLHSETTKDYLITWQEL